jgi:Ca-activated chloride channel homolog
MRNIIAALAYLFYRNNRRYTEPTLFFSEADPSFLLPNWKVKSAKLPKIFNLAALALFLVALTDPHIFIPKDQTNPAGQNRNAIPTEGIAIYLLLDQSGSMAEEVPATINGNRETLRKETLMKQVTSDFVKGRPDDLIGIVSFARVPQVLSPLTLDHEAVLNDIAQVEVVKKKDRDGTAMGYAIYKTVNMIAATKHYGEELAQSGKPSYQIKSSIIIVVTDGLQDPSILDKSSVLRNMGLEEAAQSAKSQGIKLYIINIDPNTYSAALTPQRNQMESITKLTGGRLFIVNDPGDLSQIFTDINHLEKSTLPQDEVSKERNPNLFTRISFYPYLIAIGLLLLLAGLLLNTLILRKVP